MKKIFKNKLVLIVSIIVIIIFLGYLISKFLPSFGLRYGLYPSLESDKMQRGVTNEEIYSDISGTASTNINTTESTLKLIKKGSVEINVEKGKFYESLNRIMLLVNQFNGNLISSQIYKEEDKSSGNINIMIPSKDFDNFITKLNDYGEIKNITTSTTDVSQEYYDSAGRLKVLESQRELLLSWLKDAKEIKDMLSIRSELEKIETEIESIKGRMNYIDYHSNYSEISIYLNEDVEKISWWKKSEFLNRLIDGLLYALNSILSSVLALIIFIAFILPWALVGYFIYILITKYLKRKQTPQQ